MNVGCIPKKLMHTAALMGETAKEAVAFGWPEPAHGHTGAGAGAGAGAGEVVHQWEVLRTNVQNHIKGTAVTPTDWPVAVTPTQPLTAVRLTH